MLPGFFSFSFFFFFFYPTIEVVTFRLRGWCMLGVFSLPAFTRLGHESYEPERWDVYVQRLDLGLYSHPKQLWGMESEPMLNHRGTSPLLEAQRRIKSGKQHHTGQRVQHTTD